MKVNKEIEVVQNLIRLLNECLTIAVINRRKDEIHAIKRDIEQCKTELKKLIEQRELAKN